MPVTVSTFELGHFRIFDLLQFVVACSVLIQQPIVVLALGVMLVLQLIILLLQVLVLVLTEERSPHKPQFFLFFTTPVHVCSEWAECTADIQYKDTR